ncbi:MAG: hypothetical protein MJD61_15045 [Proteobacteria bacterium]|nr:hypothetical protein [Pseudomonadota bacterium]
MTRIKAVLTEGLERLHVWRPDALSAVGTDWRDVLVAESVNHPVLVEALVESAVQRTGAGRVCVDGISPISETLCQRLRQRFERVELHVGRYPTDAEYLFGCRTRRDGACLREVECVVSAHVRAGGPRPAANDQDLLELTHPRVAQLYARRLQAHRIQLKERLDRFRFDGRQAILFVSKKAFYNQLRMSTALRRQGFRTAAVVLDSRSRGHKESYFDDVISTDLCSLLGWLSRADRARVHTQGWLFGYHVPCVIDAFLPPSCGHTIEFMDIQSLVFPTEDLNEVLPHMRAAFGQDVERAHARQLACEGYLLARADGVVFTGTESHAGDVKLSDRGRYLSFPSYPLSDFFAASASAPAEPGNVPSSLRLAFAGGIPPLDARLPAALFGDAQLLTTARALLEEGLRLDVYNNPLLARRDTFRGRYAGHLELASRFDAYRFLEGALPWDISKLLSKYHYGLMAYDFERTRIGMKHYRHIVPAKLMMYLEAGIPVLISERFVDAARFVERHRIGLSVPEGGLRSLPGLLARLDHARLREQVLRKRAELSMDRQIGQLTAFYDEVDALASSRSRRRDPMSPNQRARQ